MEHAVAAIRGITTGLCPGVLIILMKIVLITTEIKGMRIQSITMIIGTLANDNKLTRHANFVCWQ